jgi:site-specific DNA-adenine methylase
LISNSGTLAAPFPWFGGKSGACEQVWQAFGLVDNYVEPFAGSAAMLLGAPEGKRVQTINDADGFVANFWRAVAMDAEAVAHHADWPTNEVDLFARHSWLVRQRDGLLDRLHADPAYYDAQIAGWWCWGACNWIGSGWCAGNGPWVHDGERIVDHRKLPHLGDAGRGINRKLPHLGDAGRGINRQLPHLGDAGRGINRKLPHLGDAGRGINRQLPHLGDAGKGINRQLPHLGNAGRGINRQLPHLGDAGKGINRQLPHLGDAGQGSGRREYIFEWFGKLQQRLRDVRVACGDWSRVVKDSVTTRHGLTGVFLDPPYTKGAMDYSAGGVGGELARDVQAWCAANGNNKLLRIVLCGHAGEHDALLQHGWHIREWTARKGYALTDEALANTASETIWCSPHCIRPQAAQDDLFAEAA